MKKRNSIIETILVLCTCYCSLFPATARETIRIYEVNNCPKDVFPTNKLDMSNITLRVTSAGETLVSGTVYIGRIESLDHGLVIVKKCQSIETPEEACEHLTELALDNACEYITRDGEFWSTIFRALKPPLVCPLEGVYSLEDVAFDAQKLLKFSHILGNSVLKIQFRGYDGTELKVCGNTAMAIQTVISRGKKRKNKQKAN